MKSFPAIWKSWQQRPLTLPDRELAARVIPYLYHIPVGTAGGETGWPTGACAGRNRMHDRMVRTEDSKNKRPMLCDRERRAFFRSTGSFSRSLFRAAILCYDGMRSGAYRKGYGSIDDRQGCLGMTAGGTTGWTCRSFLQRMERRACIGSASRCGIWWSS